MRFARLFSIFLVAAVGSCLGPAPYIRCGDRASAKGDWKLAVEMYGRAINTGSGEVRQRYENAKTHAIQQALSTATRCAAEGDVECVDRETSYVVALGVTKKTASSLRIAARLNRAVKTARAHAQRGEYVFAVHTLAQARSLTKDPRLLANVNATLVELAPATISYVESVLAQPPPLDLKRRVAVYNQCALILQEILPFAADPLFGPDKSRLLDQVEARREAAMEELEQQMP